MTEIIREALGGLGLGKCEKSILTLNFGDVDCVKLTISKLLSVVSLFKPPAARHL